MKRCGFILLAMIMGGFIFSGFAFTETIQDHVRQQVEREELDRFVGAPKIEGVALLGSLDDDPCLVQTVIAYSKPTHVQARWMVGTLNLPPSQEGINVVSMDNGSGYLFLVLWDLREVKKQVGSFSNPINLMVECTIPLSDSPIVAQFSINERADVSQEDRKAHPDAYFLDMGFLEPGQDGEFQLAKIRKMLPIVIP